MSLVGAHETLTRYIYQQSHCKPSQRRATYAAFVPPPDKRLSVFRISGVPEIEIWNLGGSLRRHTLKGRADIMAVIVNEIGLSIDADDNPPLHAHIIGWPEDPSEVKLKAMELAAKAQFHLRS